LVLNDKYFFDDDEMSTYVGVIVDNNDPKKIGRCRIRIFGKHTSGDSTIPDEFLPWAYPDYGLSFGSSGSGSFSYPKLNSMVQVGFKNGDIYHPYYDSIKELTQGLVDQLSGSYENSHSLIFDEIASIKMFFTQEVGMMLDYGDSIMNILPDGSIVINHKDGSATIELKGSDITVVSDSTVEITSSNQITINSSLVHVNGNNTEIGPQPVYSAVMGEPLMTLLKTLATTLDAKYPTTPGVSAGVVDSFRSLILSENVKTSR